MPHGGRKGRRPGHAAGVHKHRTQDMAPATTAPPPETLVQAVVERVRAGTAPAEVAEVAAQIVEAASGGALVPLLDALASQVDEGRLVALLADLAGQPLEA